MKKINKIFYIANMRAPTERAHGIQTAKMCEALIEEGGVEIELVVPHRKNAIKESMREYYGLRVDIPTVKVFSIEPGKNRWRFNLQAFIFAVSSFLYLRKNSKPGDVIYAIDHDQFSFFMLPLLRRSVFLEVHGPKRVNSLTSFFFQRVSGIVAVSHGVAESILKSFHPLMTPAVLPNGIDHASYEKITDKKESREKLKLPAGGNIALYVGRFYDWKGLDIFLEAALALPEVLFYFVGGSRGELSRLLKTETLPDNIHCAGNRPFNEIPFWLSAADVLVLSGTKKNQYSFNETSPMKLFEYMAAKKPIVAAKTPAIASIVSDKEAFLYEPDSIESLASCMLAALKNKESAEMKAEQAYRRSFEFSWSKRAELALELIRSSV